MNRAAICLAALMAVGCTAPAVEIDEPDRKWSPEQIAEIARGEHEAGWSPEELEEITEAEADICRAFPAKCGAVGLRHLHRVEGEHGKLGHADPLPAGADIYVDEIVEFGEPGLLRRVVTHELLHLMGCWPHHHGPGIMNPGVNRDPETDHLNGNDKRLCARYFKDEY